MSSKTTRKRTEREVKSPSMAYVKNIHTVMAINRGLMILLFVFVLVTVGMSFAVYQSRQAITVYIPPDTSEGAYVVANTPGDSNVYGFAYQIMQYLYHWPSDGRKDYRANIEDLGYYLTPKFQTWLNDEYRRSSNRFGIDELDSRSRMLLPLPAHRYSAESVTRIASGVWRVNLVFRLVENIDSEKVKDTGIRYVVRVVSADVNRDTNQWGMMIDGLTEQPQRIEISGGTM